MQVVYVREGVAVWPARTERIMGRLSLINQHSVLFLAWLPYSEGLLKKDGTFSGAPVDSPPSVQSRGEYVVRVCTYLCTALGGSREVVTGTRAQPGELSP